jgi:hypothetical protein
MKSQAKARLTNRPLKDLPRFPLLGAADEMEASWRRLAATRTLPLGTTQRKETLGVIARLLERERLRLREFQDAFGRLVADSFAKRAGRPLDSIESRRAGRSVHARFVRETSTRQTTRLVAAWGGRPRFAPLGLRAWTAQIRSDLRRKHRRARRDDVYRELVVEIAVAAARERRQVAHTHPAILFALDYLATRAGDSSASRADRKEAKQRIEDIYGLLVPKVRQTREIDADSLLAELRRVEETLRKVLTLRNAGLAIASVQETLGDRAVQTLRSIRPSWRTGSVRAVALKCIASMQSPPVKSSTLRQWLKPSVSEERTAKGKPSLAAAMLRHPS